MKMKIQNHKLFCVSNGYYLNKNAVLTNRKPIMANTRTQVDIAFIVSQQRSVEWNVLRKREISNNLEKNFYT